MSNPAVFKLNQTNIRNNIINIEDNIGESIHFHLGIVRFDLSILEFDNVTKVLLSILNQQLNLSNFNLNEQNEYFLEKIAPYIPYITSVNDEIVKVKDIKCLYEKEIDYILEDFIINSPIYKYYLGNKKIISDYEIDTDIWKTKEEVLDSVIENRNNNIYLDEYNRVLDGHKSLCIGIVNGDILEEISIKKIICEDKSIKRVLKKVRNKW